MHGSVYAPLCKQLPVTWHLLLQLHDVHYEDLIGHVCCQQKLYCWSQKRSFWSLFTVPAPLSLQAEDLFVNDMMPSALT